MTTFDLNNIWNENGRIKKGRIRIISKALTNMFILISNNFVSGLRMVRFLMARKGLPKENEQHFPSRLYDAIAEDSGSKKDSDEMTNPETQICTRKARSIFDAHGQNKALEENQEGNKSLTGNQGNPILGKCTRGKEEVSHCRSICTYCDKKLLFVERVCAEGKFFHRTCFRCDYCGVPLRCYP